MKRDIANLLVSTRINRVLPSVALILFACAYANKITTEAFLLCILVILLYAPGGILNAIKDNDFNLPKYSKFVVIALPVVAIIISTYNFILFLATCSWIFFGYIYNVLSRKLVLFDTTIIGITHHFIPTFFALILLDINPLTSFLIGFYFYLTNWFISPIKNLNGIKKDKELGYKTLPAIFENGEKITKNLFNFSIIPIIASVFLCKQNYFSIFFILIILGIYLFAQKIINIENKNASLEMARLIFSFFPLAIAFAYTNNFFIISSNSLISILFFSCLIKRIKSDFYKQNSPFSQKQK